MTPAQLRMARNALRLGVRDLAEISGVSFTTISRFETERGGINHATAEKLREALEAAGIEFIAENGGGAGVRFRERSPKG